MRHLANHQPRKFMCVWRTGCGDGRKETRRLSRAVLHWMGLCPFNGAHRHASRTILCSLALSCVFQAANVGDFSDRRWKSNIVRTSCFETKQPTMIRTVYVVRAIVYRASVLGWCLDILVVIAYISIACVEKLPLLLQLLDAQLLR